MDTRSGRTASAETFDCSFPGCDASYRRKEHLLRHRTQHNQPQSFKCSVCNRTFGRNDTLRRHMRRAHAVDELPSQIRRACSQCRGLKSRCEGGQPCRECIRRKTLCSFDDPRRTNSQESLRHLTDRVPEPSHATSLRTERRDRHFVDLYFERFHPHWPFVHRVSFQVSKETPLLTQSMMVIGLWASGEQSAQRAALDLHRTLDLAIHQQREVWDASIAEDAGSTCAWPIATYQAILLHVMFAIIHQGGSSVGFDLKFSLPPAGTQLLDSLVGSCKRLGMFNYPNIIAQHLPGSMVEIAWVGIEEIKRFNLTLYKVHKLLSRRETEFSLAEGGTVAETSSVGLAAIDLQFPIPTNSRLWSATNKEEWMSAPKDAGYFTLNDAKEDEWISKSAELVGLLA